MPFPFGWMSLAVLVLYLSLFFWGGALAARAAGRSIWLSGSARGPERWAAIGFRAAFVSALFGPLLWLALPPLRAADPRSDTRPRRCSRRNRSP